MQFGNPITTSNPETVTLFQSSAYPGDPPAGGFTLALGLPYSQSFYVPSYVRSIAIAGTFFNYVSPAFNAQPMPLGTSFKVEFVALWSGKVYWSQTLTGDGVNQASFSTNFPFVPGAEQFGGNNQPGALCFFRITQLTGPVTGNNWSRISVVGYGESGAIQVLNTPGQTFNVAAPLGPPVFNTVSGTIGPGNPTPVTLAGPYANFGILIQSASAVAYGGGAGSFQGVNVNSSYSGRFWSLLLGNNSSFGVLQPPNGIWIPPTYNLNLADSTVVIAGGTYVVVTFTFSLLTQAQFNSYFLQAN